MKQNETIPAFPLAWPVGVPRTTAQQRKQSTFGSFEWKNSISSLHRELALLGGRYSVISTNQPIRQDGLPYAQTRRIDDPGVAVYFIVEGEQVCLPCDRFTSIADNLRAITKHIEAMRGQQRWGVGTAKQAFAGYKALAAQSEERWDEVLNIGPDATLEEIERAFRVQAMSAHPDRNGGDNAPMQRLNLARDRARADRSAR